MTSVINLLIFPLSTTKYFNIYVPNYLPKEDKMTKIDIDQEVFEFLQKNAKPFVDTPNMVIRRLLHIGKFSSTPKSEVKSTMEPTGTSTGMDTNEFVSTVLSKDFPEGPQRKSPYRFMFESASSLIYFQNFNKDSATLWYRINQKPFKVLKDSRKKCFICLTNPAEGVAYLIPLEEIEKKLITSKWSRDYLEINIDHVSSKWKELDWDIKQYLKTY